MLRKYTYFGKKVSHFLSDCSIFLFDFNEEKKKLSADGLLSSSITLKLNGVVNKWR